NYYNISDEITSRKTVKYYELSILVQHLLNANHIDQAAFNECKTIEHNHVRIMTRSVFVEKLLHNPHKEECSDSFHDQTIDTYNAQQTTTAYKDLFDDISVPIDNTVTVTSETTSVNNYRVKADEQDDNPEASQQKMPPGYEFTTLPDQIQSIVDENDLTRLRGRTNHHRMLLSAVFKDVVDNYSLL
ncbi:unnamed protein product, partial [Didymodactylos carnosus]